MSTAANSVDALRYGCALLFASPWPALPAAIADASPCPFTSPDQAAGDYPAPPFWPDRLTDRHLFMPDVAWSLYELDFAVHTFIGNGTRPWCDAYRFWHVTTWVGDRFAGWTPTLWQERSERVALHG